MCKKYKLEYVKEYLSNKGLSILDEENYIHSKSKITVIDKNSFKYKITFNEFLQYNKTMKPFATFNPYTIENIKNYLLKNNPNNTLISTEYKGSDCQLTFTCESCREEYNVSFKHFRNANQTKCKKCNAESNADGKRNNFDEIIIYFSSRGLTILDEEYKNNTQRFNVIDKYGYKGKISYTSLKYSDDIKIFSKTNPHTIYNIKHYIKINNIKCELISDKYVSKNEKIKFKCECGDTFETTLGTLRFQNKFRCDKCSKKQSRLSYLTEEYLKYNNIEYIYEYSINDCKNKRALSFDFAVFMDNNLKLIECDGEQHFTPVKFNGISEHDAEKSHAMTKKNDDIKNKYCKNNNIELIRIPYWNYDNDNYKNILNNKLYIQA